MRSREPFSSSFLQPSDLLGFPNCSEDTSEGFVQKYFYYKYQLIISNA